MTPTPTLTPTDARAVMRALAADAEASWFEGCTDLQSAYLLGRRDAFATGIRLLGGDA